MYRVAEVPWFIQPRAEELKGRSHSDLQLLMGSRGAALRSALWWQQQGLRKWHGTVSVEEQRLDSLPDRGQALAQAAQCTVVVAPSHWSSWSGQCSQTVLGGPVQNKVGWSFRVPSNSGYSIDCASFFHISSCISEVFEISGLELHVAFRLWAYWEFIH